VYKDRRRALTDRLSPERVHGNNSNSINKKNNKISNRDDNHDSDFVPVVKIFNPRTGQYEVEEDSGVSAPTNETAPRRAVPVAPPPGLGQPKFRGGRSPPSGTVKDRLGIAPAAMNHKKPDQGRVGSRDSGTGAETGGKVPAADASRGSPPLNGEGAARTKGKVMERNGPPRDAESQIEHDKRLKEEARLREELQAELDKARAQAVQAEEMVDQMRKQAELLLRDKQTIKQQNTQLEREMTMLQERVTMAETAMQDTELFAEELEEARFQLEHERDALERAKVALSTRLAKDSEQQVPTEVPQSSTPSSTGDENLHSENGASVVQTDEPSDSAVATPQLI